MKRIHKSISLLLAFILCFFGNTIIGVNAHNLLLDVEYDLCEDSEGDGINESWYYIAYDENTYQHIDESVSSIKYFFAPSAKNNSNYTWTTDVSESVANEIKQAYANSMKKWNNVYFYSYDSIGNVTKRKVIDVVEVKSEQESNLVIYPSSGNTYVAYGQPVSSYEELGDANVSHRHYSEWEMFVFPFYFYVHDNIDAVYVNAVRERNGAHELSHMLGLFDIDDDYCCASGDNNHHHELLMGYGTPMTARSLDITYKDIAGVAITRGFHTDSDHEWLNAGLQADESDENYGKYKLICSICNGVKYVNDLSGYTYDTFLSCDSDHTMNSGNLMAVASYGDKDYYKCKYCRYVAPFSSIVTQDYSVSPYSYTQHKYTNNVDGLNYSFLEEHDFALGECVTCGHVHSHSYTYTYLNGSKHSGVCSCGVRILEGHSVRRAEILEGRYANCLGCGASLDLDNDNALIIMSKPKVTINGSYILPNGIVVLVDEDMEAYLNGTLVFYDADDTPTVE